MKKTRARRFLQFHLSTAVIMMLLAGGLMWSNTRKRTLETFVLNLRGHPVAHEYGRGWPLAYHRWEFEKDESSQTNLILDGVFCVGVLLAAGIAVEYFIRRREPQKP
jgi:hypothetical protein